MRSSETRTPPARVGRNVGRGALWAAVAGLAFWLVPAAVAAQEPPAAPTPAAPVASVPPALYTQIELVGARPINDTDLVRALRLPVAADSLQPAIARLASVLFAHGYLQATVAHEPAAPGLLRLRIDAGAQARVAHVFQRGTEELGEDAVTALLGVRAGGPFAPMTLEAGLQALVEAYARRGYLQVTAVVERLELEPDGGVVVGIGVVPGPLAHLSEVQVQGNTHSRSTLVQRLAGLGATGGIDLRRLHESTLRLRRSGLFAAVDEPLVYRAGTAGDDLGVVLRVTEATQRNVAFGSVGVAQDPRDQSAYVHGAFDAQLRNIWGTGRDLGLAWKRDALAGSALAVSYHERFLFGWRVDFDAALSQTVRDSTYTFQSAGAAVILPLRANLGLELGGAFDRSVFHIGATSEATRWRGRTGLLFQSLASAGDGRPYGRLEVRAEWATRTNTVVLPDDPTRVQQTVWSGRFESGLPLGSRHELWSRGTWQALFSSETEVAASELYYFGGARTLRGYREEQFRGDQVAYGGVEYRFGDPRGARVYAFVDGGGLRRKQAGTATVHEAHWGYGLGLRGPFATGDFDLAFGLGEERSWSGTKLHVALLQRF